MRQIASTAPFAAWSTRAAGALVVGWAAWQPCPADVLPRAPREAAGQLVLARDAAAEERYSELFLLLERLLSSDEDAFAAPARTGGVRRTIRAEATALLASLPPGQFDAWETWYGGRAREALDAAAGGRDRLAMADVALRFPRTAAGEEAALLLACDGLDRHRPLEALAWLRRLEQNGGTAARFGYQTALLTAAAYLIAGQADRAADVLTQLPSMGHEDRVRLGDAEIAPDDPQRLALALAAAAGPLLHHRKESGAAWTMFRGAPSRNAASNWPGTVERLLWAMDAGGPGQPQSTPPTAIQGQVQVQAIRIGQVLSAPLPAGHPLVDGSLVLARWPRRLIAVDAPTGRLLWEYPWGGDATAGTRTLPRELAQHQVPLGMGSAEDASGGQIASDGQRLFLIDGTSPAPAHVLARTAGPSHNRLVALSVAKEGKLEWSVGGESGEDEPALAGAFFLGPPLAHEGRLHVLVELAGELHLSVLDAPTGRLEWSLLLAVPEMPINADPQRWLAGTVPSMADGILVCPTSAGAVVAVDPAARAILWGYGYPVSLPRTRAMQLQVLRFTGQSQGPATSLDPTATIADGHVLLAPIESGELLCLDLFSGDLVWSRTIPDMLYVACVTDATVVTVGEATLSAWHLRTGKPAWTELATELPEGAKTSGRGVAAGRWYFLPTTETELLQIRAATGRIEQRLALAGEQAHKLGNLVAVGPLLVSQSAEGIQAFTAQPAVGND